MIELSAIWEAGKFAFGSYAWARKQLKKESAFAIERVNSSANPSGQIVKVHRVIKRVPTIAITGPGSFSAEIAASALEIRPKLELNEVHALAHQWDGSDVDCIRAETCDFADVLALRAQSQVSRQPPPAVISAGAVLICPEARSLIVHRRSSTSATYPNALHILGGAYKPSVQYKNIDDPGDRSSLEFTMIREVFEESGLIVRRYDEPVCVAEEIDTGFIQYVYLGVRVTAAQFGQLSQNSEGDLVKVSFDELPKLLSKTPQWVPTGRAQILMWLGLGAPGGGWNAKFDGQTAEEAFKSLTR